MTGDRIEVDADDLRALDGDDQLPRPSIVNLDNPGTHCDHWWAADPDSDVGTACCWCGDDSTEGDDTFTERCDG